MNVTGLIVEYNPLHHGHVYHYNESKRMTKADAVIAVMSGNFLQRGEPAFVNKWARTKMALHMGVDLVIELPVLFSTQPAEWFAYGAVSVLEATGIVNALCFGSESGQLEQLNRWADLLVQEPENFRTALHSQLKKGVPYPAAYSAAAATSQIANPDLLRQPNNSLGLHYLMALKRLNSSIKPYTVERLAAHYHQSSLTHRSIASATAVRKLLMDEQDWQQFERYVPPYTVNILREEVEEGRGFMSWEQFFQPMMHLLYSSSEKQLTAYAEISEGLENRIKQQLHRFQGHTINEWIDILKTKRYTRTKIQRTLLRILLQHEKHSMDKHLLAKGAPYLRVLGFSQKGKQLLKQMKKAASVPVILQADRDVAHLLEMDIHAAAVYANSYPSRQSAKEIYADFYRPPVQIDSRT